MPPCVAPSSPPPTRLPPTDGGCLPLPPEILVCVLKSLPTADLASCLRINSGFALLSLPVLYRHVRLSQHAWPTYDDGAVPGPLSSSRPAFLSLAPLVQCVRHLDIYYHSTQRCMDTLPPHPNLTVLRVFLGTMWSGRRIYHIDTTTVCCSALLLLRPKKVVIRGLTFAHPTVPRLARPLADGVRHLVAVFEPEAPFILPRNGLVAARMAAVHFRHYLPPNISHLTLVFKTQNGENWRNGNVTLSWALVHAYASALWAEAIAWTCKGGQLCIVNAGALAVAKEEEPPYVPDCAALQAAVRRYFAIRIAEQMGDDAPRTMERLTFLSMDEYLASPDAGDVFDRNE